MDIPGKKGDQKRVVIVGAGFAGLTLAKRLSSRYFQVILIDKNNLPKKESGKPLIAFQYKDKGSMETAGKISANIEKQIRLFPQYFEQR